MQLGARAALVVALALAVVAAPVRAQRADAAHSARAHVSDARGCLVAARALPRGTTLRAADVDLRPEPRCRMITAPDSIVGWITRRVIAAGEPLRAPAVATPPLVSAGQPVELVWVSDQITLTLHGTALSAAARGEQVWVRLGEKRRVQGTVTAPGLVHAFDSKRSS